MMEKNLRLAERLEQVHGLLIGLARLLERAGVRPRPEIGEGWVDGQEVMQALHISRRTLQSLRDNGTLGYTALGKKYYYRIGEIDELLRNNYVMYRLHALGKPEESEATGKPEEKAAARGEEGGDE